NPAAGGPGTGPAPPLTNQKKHPAGCFFCWVAKYGQRTPPGAPTICPSLAHGLPMAGPHFQ
ncbi:hypothetical protein EFQ32_05440, partial [Limosilactobacillus fermentum]|nr:hypothetical protein [Limosilactobacillus fermentum]